VFTYTPPVFILYLFLQRQCTILTLKTHYYTSTQITRRKWREMVQLASRIISSHNKCVSCACFWFREMYAGRWELMTSCQSSLRTMFSLKFLVLSSVFQQLLDYKCQIFTYRRQEESEQIFGRVLLWSAARLLGSRVRVMAVRLLCFVMRCVVRGLSDELHARSEESYLLCVCVYVCVCDLETSTRRRPGRELGCSPTEKNCRDMNWKASEYLSKWKVK